MAPSELPESITFLLGPPARPDERANFDRYQAEFAGPTEKRDQKFCWRGSPSPIEQLFEMVLGLPIRIRWHSVGFGFIRGQHIHNLHFPWSDVLTPKGPLPPLSRGDTQSLAAAIGYALKLDWVCAQVAWPDSAPRARRAAEAR